MTLDDEQEPLAIRLIESYETADYDMRAAVSVLAYPCSGGHPGFWLTKESLLRLINFRDTDDPIVDWDAVADYTFESPASSGELRMLRLACSLAGGSPERHHMGADWTLSFMLHGLYNENLRVARTAVGMVLSR